MDTGKNPLLQRRKLSVRIRTGPVYSIPAQRRTHIMNLLSRSISKLTLERKKTIDESTDRALLWILDAFDGRIKNGLAENSLRSEWIYNVYRIQSSVWLRNAIIALSVTHTIAVFMESAGNSGEFFLTGTFLLNTLTLLVYFADMVMKMTYEGMSVRYLFTVAVCLSKIIP